MPALPQGPTWSRPVQTLAWVTRPGPFMARARERHGDAFTLTIGHEPPWVMISDPAAVREVFTGDPAVFHAGEGNRVLRPVLGPNSVLLLDEKPHLRQRRLLLPPFHGDRVAAWAGAIAEIAEREAAGWAGSVVTHRRMQELALEVITQVVFGVRRGPLHDALRDTLDLVAGLRGILLMAVLGPDRAERAGIFRSALRRVDELIFEEIARRRGAPGDDVLSLLLEATHEDGSPMSDQELRDELTTLLVAGHETTATALAWALERLSHHPGAWARLREEGDAYADAVVKETLRLRPVIPIVIRHLKRDVTVGGLDLPAGVNVVPSIWLLHRREDVYPEPHAFRPERWLGAKPGTYTWIPFGGGVRRCLGAAFAELEMRTTLVALARRLELSPDPAAANGRAEPVRRRAITLAPARGGRVLVSPR